MSATPNALDDVLFAVGIAMSKTPPKPTSNPRTWLRCGKRLCMSEATVATNNGVAPLSMPVTLLDTCCSAKGKRLSGIAIQNTPSNAMDGRSFLGMCLRDCGNAMSARKPKRIRKGVMSAGSKASRPSAMKKKLEPQISPGMTSSNQSLRPMR